jgi:hypothetical protein
VSSDTGTPKPRTRQGTNGPAAPALPAELEALLRRMRLPYLGAAAPDVIATAKAQRWDPAEVLRVLLTEEVIGRDAATRRMRRKSANFPAGKTLATWRTRRGVNRSTHPASTVHPGMNRPGREPGHCRPVRHRKVAFRRSIGARRDRRGPAGGLVHPRDGRTPRPAATSFAAGPGALVAQRQYDGGGHHGGHVDDPGDRGPRQADVTGVQLVEEPPIGVSSGQSTSTLVTMR